ncbi:ras-related protein Rab-15 isoform X1 [Falco cherrug]|uniref:ras-related protein Rab-15 isoform X1 n=2 Tax=Falco cherrug TaxID=345164 RepID=UPI002478882E|nr:ras-related protein Rab-15 isoform X1 [Falco cherrug]
MGTGSVGEAGTGEPWALGKWEHPGNGSTRELENRWVLGTGKPGALGKRETVGTGEVKNREMSNHGHRGTGKPQAPGNGKAVGTREPVTPRSWETGSIRKLWAPGNWEHWGAAALGKWEAVGTDEPGAPGSHITGEPGAPGNRVDFKMKTIEVDGIKVRIQIWDTAGQERYQTITKQYYRRAQGIFLVYDISSERSYQHIVKWASDVDEYAPDGVQKILIGNKADEEHKRQVAKEQGLQLAREYGMDFYETSACSNLNIKESFTRLTELVLQAHRKELEGLRAPPPRPRPGPPGGG